MSHVHHWLVADDGAATCGCGEARQFNTSPPEYGIESAPQGSRMKGTRKLMDWKAQRNAEGKFT